MGKKRVDTSHQDLLDVIKIPRRDQTLEDRTLHSKQFPSMGIDWSIDDKTKTYFYMVAVSQDPLDSEEREEILGKRRKTDSIELLEAAKVDYRFLLLNAQQVSSLGFIPSAVLAIALMLNEYSQQTLDKALILIDGSEMPRVKIGIPHALKEGYGKILTLEQIDFRINADRRYPIVNMADGGAYALLGRFRKNSGSKHGIEESYKDKMVVPSIDHYFLDQCNASQRGEKLFSKLAA